MKKILLAFLAVLVISGCNKKKPKPISGNITKTTVMVGDTKDSVINNTHKNYGTATISDPCAQILLSNIKSTAEFKRVTVQQDAKGIIWLLNWVKAEEPRIITNGSKITNGIEAVIFKKEGKERQKIGSFLFDNENAQVYYVNIKGEYDLVKDIKADELKHIRNGCYWGVASHK